MFQRFCDWQLLHPICRFQFRNLAARLEEGYLKGETHTHFKLFETYRSPERQEECFVKKTSKAQAWQSPHNYGFAGDFVAWVNDKEFSWDDSHDYQYLGRIAADFNLLQPMQGWDPYHIESPYWRAANAVLIR